METEGISWTRQSFEGLLEGRLTSGEIIASAILPAPRKRYEGGFFDAVVDNLDKFKLFGVILHHLREILEIF